MDTDKKRFIVTKINHIIKPNGSVDKARHSIILDVFIDGEAHKIVVENVIGQVRLLSELKRKVAELVVGVIVSEDFAFVNGSIDYQTGPFWFIYDMAKILNEKALL